MGWTGMACVSDDVVLTKDGPNPACGVPADPAVISPTSNPSLPKARESPRR